LFAISLAVDHPECLVEQAVNGALGETMREAEGLVLQRFGEVTLGDLARDFDARYGAACAPAGQPPR
jgi:ribosomal protein S3AE